MPQYFDSSQASAPQLDGSIGSLIAVLDACLVNGFGSEAKLDSWEKSFSGTNKAAYRSTDVDSTGFYLRVDDTATQSSPVSGYESMIDVDNGTNEFLGSNYLWVKADSTSGNRPWFLFGDSKFFIFGVAWETSNTTGYYLYWFGDITTFKANDNYHCMFSAYIKTSNPTGPNLNEMSGIFVAERGSMVMARSYDQVATNIECEVPTNFHDQTLSGTDISAAFDYQDLNRADDSVLLCPIYVYEAITGSGVVMRGEVPYCYWVISNQPGNHGDVLQGIPELPGRELTMIEIMSSATAAGNGRILIDMTDI